MKIDVNVVADALVACDIGGPAREEGARLVEGWINRMEEYPENKWKVIFVEAPFYIQLEEKVIIVGQMDAGFHTGEMAVLGEWKSRRAPKLKKDGNPWAGDDEAGWLVEISNGPQLGVYALAGREGTFLPFDNPAEELSLGVPEPTIMVRAAVKSSPVQIWQGMFTFPTTLLDTVRAALLSEAVSIRARRKLGMVPYQIPGLQCTNMYHRVCQYLEPVCRPKATPPVEVVGWHHPDDKNPDPGFEICGVMGLDAHDPELVVLSASALGDHYQCAELARIRYGGFFPAEEQYELSVGTALHRGLAAVYRQWGK